MFFIFQFIGKSQFSLDKALLLLRNSRLVHLLVFKAYFEQEKSMGEAAVLATCAEKAGMKDTAAAVLADESLMAEETQAEMRQYGRAVSGVPFFIVDGAYALSGAQEPEAFLDLFKKLGMPS